MRPLQNAVTCWCREKHAVRHENIRKQQRYYFEVSVEEDGAFNNGINGLIEIWLTR